MKKLNKVAEIGSRAYGELLHRADAWQNVLTGLGNIDKDRLVGHQIAASVPTTPAELTALYHDDPLAQKIAAKPIKEALRQGVGFVSDDPNLDPDTQDEQAKLIEDEFQRLRLMDRVYDAAIWSRVFGLGVVLLGAEGDATDPLGDVTVPLRYAITLERHSHQVWPEIFYSLDEEGPLGEPKIYQASRVGEESALIHFHESRALVFRGETTSWEQRQLNQYVDYPILHWCKDALRNYNSLIQSIGLMATDASTAVLKIKGFFQSMLKANQADVKARLAIVDLAKMVGRIMPLDAEGEAYEIHDRTFSGLSDLVDRQEAQLASAADMSITMLFGRSPAGLNSTGESDARNDMNAVKSIQDHLLAPQLDRVVKIVAGYVGVTNPETWSVEFPSLWQRDPDQEAAHRKAVAETDAIWIQNEVVTPEEVAETRFGRPGEFDDGPVQVDLAAREQEEPAPAIDPLEAMAMAQQERMMATGQGEEEVQNELEQD